MKHVFWCLGHELLVNDIVSAEGCWLHDSHGKRFVDMTSGVWCTPLGHCHPEVYSAMISQGSRIGHSGFSYTSPIVEQAAAAVCEVVGFPDGQCLFLSSGSEAVEFTMQAARIVAKNPKFLIFSDSFFGSYGSAKERNSDEWQVFDTTNCFQCDRSECSSCPNWESIAFGELGGFLFEPGSSSGLVRFPPKHLVQQLSEQIQKDGGLVLVNEVTTGMGRTGEWFGFQHFGITPDCVVLGKGLGNGYPVSACVIHHDLAADLLSKDFHYFQSHQNDPLGAAVADAVIRTMRQGEWVEKGRLVSQILIEQLTRLAEIPGSPIQAIRARGLMMIIELDPKRISVEQAKRIQRNLCDRGFIACLKPNLTIFRIDPPLILSQELAEKFVAEFGHAIEQVNAESGCTTISV